MNGAEHYQREMMDRDILTFTREAVRQAPVTIEALTGFLRNIRRRNVTERDVLDRVTYLVGVEYLREHKDWVPGSGELLFYTITADGMDVMDGVKPPRGWQGK